MTVLSPSPKAQFLDANGAPLSGGKVYTYAAGTTTPLATYTTAAGTVANTNPVVLDSRGEANIWFSTGTAYKVKLASSTDVEIWTVDNITTQGNMATQNASAVAITGGTISGVTVSGTFTGNITGNVTGNVTGNAGTVTNGVYLTGAQTLTDKRVTPRISSTTSFSTPLSWNSDSYDEFAATAQAGNVTINADSGTPTDGQKVLFRITCDGSPRTITFTGGAAKAFKPVGASLTVSGSDFTYTATASKTVYFGAIYNTTSARWEVVALSQEV